MDGIKMEFQHLLRQSSLSHCRVQRTEGNLTTRMSGEKPAARSDTKEISANVEDFLFLAWPVILSLANLLSFSGNRVIFPVLKFLILFSSLCPLPFALVIQVLERSTPGVSHRHYCRNMPRET